MTCILRYLNFTLWRCYDVPIHCDYGTLLYPKKCIFVHQLVSCTWFLNLGAAVMYLRIAIMVFYWEDVVMYLHIVIMSFCSTKKCIFGIRCPDYCKSGFLVSCISDMYLNIACLVWHTWILHYRNSVMYLHIVIKVLYCTNYCIIFLLWCTCFL